jgi:hypothetical protein
MLIWQRPHSRVLAIVVLISLLSLSVVMRGVSAQQLNDRSILISTAVPSATATHSYQFTYFSTVLTGSVIFEYCQNSPVFNEICDPPPGLDVSAATLNGQSGNLGYSFDGADSTANKIVLSRPAVAAVAVASTYTFGNVTNPSTPGHSEFVRISTHANSDGSGPVIDNGGVAFYTVSPFTIGANVPTFLKLCVAIAVTPDCSSISGDQINLGTLTSNAPKAAQSQFAIGTNSLTGYITYVLGTTMTSGTDTITALSSPTPSFPGNGQFGINLRANSNPSVGDDPSGAGTGAVSGNYNTPNFFMFSSGDPIVSSSQPTEYNRLTVSYLVNVGQSQPSGVYASTFSYVAVANF